MLSMTQRWLALGGLAAVVLGLVAGVHLAFRSPEQARRRAAPAEDPPLAQRTLREPPPEYFKSLLNPEVVLLVSGQLYSYLQPCGCARPQTGGLERRYQLLSELRAKGWAVSAVDVGDVAPKANDPSRRLREQGRVQFESALQILHKMDYSSLGLGYAELTLPLDQTLGFGLNYQPPYFIAANLGDPETKFPEMYRAWSLDEPWQRVRGAMSGLRIGYVGIIGASVAKKAKEHDATLSVDPVEPALTKALQELAEKQPHLQVLVFQGTRAEARELGPRFPQFRLILTLDDSDEPSALPERLGEQMFISTGHKGKNVGLVGVFKDGEKFDLQYQLVTLTEHFEPAEDQTNPAREAMRDYVLRVHRDNFLEKWPRTSHPLQLDFPEAHYAGASACKACHPMAHAIWSSSKHSKAYENLAKYGRPLAKKDRKDEPPLIIGRQFDPECVRCHATGFEFKTGFVSETKTPHLLGNQCENCHGPASLHVADPRNPKFWRPLHLSIGSFENSCRKCHDGDNDPNFKLETYWPQVRHPRD